MSGAKNSLRTTLRNTLIAFWLAVGIALASPARAAVRWPEPFLTTNAYNAAILDRVDKLVASQFCFRKEKAAIWQRTILCQRKQVLASKNLQELGLRINACLDVLATSHCKFLSRNDEAYYLLHSMFAVMGGKRKRLPLLMDYCGFVSGGVNCADNVVRYVLDGSPAQQAGLLSGDCILSVNGKPYVGQVNFWGQAGRAVRLQVRRQGEILSVRFVPQQVACYPAYLRATMASARVDKDGIGYIHYWMAGHESFDKFVAEKFARTAGLILDLRDGYGGFFSLSNFISPDKNVYIADRRFQAKTSKYLYTRPLVAVINGGARSGKELLAMYLQKSRRALLVGEPTAGAGRPGRLFKIDERTALYLAVDVKPEPGQVEFEGHGVRPDVEVKSDCTCQSRDKQLAAARDVLLKSLPAGKTHE